LRWSLGGQADFSCVGFDGTTGTFSAFGFVARTCLAVVKADVNPSLNAGVGLNWSCVASRLLLWLSEKPRGDDEKVIGVGERANVVGGEEDKVIILAIFILHD
jgi:hypothetical protein